MSTKTKLDELKELAEFGCSLGSAIGTALADGKVEIAEVGLLLPPAMLAPVAFAGVSDAVSALANLSTEDAASLKSHIESKFDIPQDNLEAKIEAGLGLALDVWSRVQIFIPKKTA